MSTRYVLRALPFSSSDSNVSSAELQNAQPAWVNYWQDIQLPKARFNIGPHPHKTAPLISNKGYEEMLFGMKPSWAKSILLNAKAEGIKQSKFWKPLAAMRPCLIPADGFYVVDEFTPNDESSSQRTWYGVEFSDHRAFFMAGMWKAIKDDPKDKNKRALRFVLLSRESQHCVSKLTTRMPVLFNQQTIQSAQTWMNTELTLDARINALLTPFDYHDLISFPVGKTIKNLGNDEPSLFSSTALSDVTNLK